MLFERNQLITAASFFFNSFFMCYTLFIKNKFKNNQHKTILFSYYSSTETFKFHIKLKSNQSTNRLFQYFILLYLFFLCFCLHVFICICVCNHLLLSLFVMLQFNSKTLGINLSEKRRSMCFQLFWLFRSMQI